MEDVLQANMGLVYYARCMLALECFLFLLGELVVV